MGEWSWQQKGPMGHTEKPQNSPILADIICLEASLVEVPYSLILMRLHSCIRFSHAAVPL